MSEPERPQCGAAGPGGFRCILLDGHQHYADHDPQRDPEHLSIDYREEWNGTPGKPIRWQDPKLEPVATSSAGAARLVETAKKGPMQIGKASAVHLVIPGLPTTGRVCHECGGANMVVEGRCEKCLECGATTGCGG